MKFNIKLCFYSILLLNFSTAFGQQPNDCTDAIIACGNSSINLDVSGVGTQELNNSNTCGPNGTSLGESNSVWLKVTLVTGGTLGFTLTPNSSAISEDYDFYVFGPNPTCGNIGQAIRCSSTNPQAANQGNNLTGMRSSETDTSEGPGAAGNSFVRWLDVNAGDTYFIVIDRPIGNSPFSLEWTGTATFSEPPTNEADTIGTPLDFEMCDDTAPFSDGFTDFNLSDNTSPIIGSQSNLTITYHDSESDANIGIGELPNTYRNISNPQTIYARITNNITECFELTEFELNVNLGPNFAEPIDFVLCDNLDDGDDKNGRVIFNLSSKNDEILDGQSISDINIFYYTSLPNAENRMGALPSLYYNETPFNEQVFVRIEDATNQNCRSFTTLNLIANPVPDAFDYTILQCDEDGVVDGLTLFNLNEANADLTGNTSGMSTKFYTDSSRTIEVSGDLFPNTINPQTIYVKVINDNTSCINNSELTLEVSVTDSNDTFLPAACDDDGLEDGFYEFNLNEATTNVTNGLPIGLSVSYFETYEDALLEENVLNTTYTNTIPYNQTIYARVENANNCYGISEVTLTVLELPNIVIEDLVYYCLNDFPNTIPINAALINDSPTNYSYNWSTGENTYEIQINATGNYTVTVTDSNNCSKNRVVTVESSNIASFQSIEVVDVSENNTITVLVSGEGTYQYSLIGENDDTIKPYQDSNLFENVFPGIYTILVRDIKNDCGIVPENVFVIGFPKYFTPNNDGINDTWQVYGVSSMFQSDTKVLIFNRFGKLIKEINPLGEGWNGRFNGEILPTDDYWFTVKLQDGRIFKNHFTLKH